MSTERSTAELLSAPLADRYVLKRELGRGGMATVWLARDLQHERPVALKLLRPELGSVLARERFGREIAIAARLSHPHILPLLDSGTVAVAGVGTVLWYAMPYVAGRSLRHRLSGGPALSLAESLTLVSQVARALDHAHARGVIHRDVKPQNILLSGDDAVVADFGIARALELAGGERLTETGIVLGTPAYMSPEQASASGRVDGRSDVYSLACVLYEMLTGEPPFTGPTPEAIIARRLTAPLPRLSVVRPDLPPTLERVVTRALARAPADRYGSAREFAEALAAVLSAAPHGLPAPSRRSRGRLRLWTLTTAGGALSLIAGVWYCRTSARSESPQLDPGVVAVLPFTVSAPDSASDYLREGVVDLLNARLTGEGMPRAVDSRTTLARWRRAGRGGDLSTEQALELAQGLGAGRVVLGRFVRTPAGLSVSGRVLRVPDGAVVTEHGETGAAGTVDELELVDRWTSRVFAATAGEAADRLGYLSDSTFAAKAYLAGRQAHRRGEFSTAARLYQRALEIDSNFALAAYWLSKSTGQTAMTGTHEQMDEWARQAWSLRDRLAPRDRETVWYHPDSNPSDAAAIEAAERAVSVAPDRPEVWEALGSSLLYFGAVTDAERWFPRAVVAIDSAIRLDSGFVAALWERLHLALISGDREAIRPYGELYLRSSPAGDSRVISRWLIAQALGDSAELEHVRRELRLAHFGSLIALSIQSGHPLAGVERVLAARYPGAGRLPPDDQCELLRNLMHIAIARGSVARAVAFADSLNLTPGNCGGRRIMIRMSVAEPAFAGDAVSRYARQVAQQADTAGDDGPLCHVELWRLSRGDTSHTRRSLARLKLLGQDPSDVCLLLIEAGIALQRSGSEAPPAVERLESRLTQGVSTNPYAPLGNLLLARYHAARGDAEAGVRAARRRNLLTQGSMIWPALLQDEGRLAALAGDTTAAVRAYQHYLRVRDRPDPGPMQEQVTGAKAHLAELLRKRPGH